METEKKGKRSASLVKAQKKYYEKMKTDPEYRKKRAEWSRNYYNEHPEKYNKRREMTDEEKAKNRETVKKYYYANRERILEKRKKNTEKKKTDKLKNIIMLIVREY
jgi:ABC-type nitrate/sulfonate/bicarbonate transport system substrate-binding protein